MNEPERKVKVKNYTDKIMFRAFGVVETPDYDQYLEFLESRCFPSSRDKMKLILKDLDLPFYDPMMIIEKTEGRMAEDDFWIRIERYIHDRITKKDVTELLANATSYPEEIRSRVEKILSAQMRKYAYLFP